MPQIFLLFFFSRNFGSFDSIFLIFSPDFALAYVQKLYTDFLAAQQSADQVFLFIFTMTAGEFVMIRTTMAPILDHNLSIIY